MPVADPGATEQDRLPQAPQLALHEAVLPADSAGRSLGTERLEQLFLGETSRRVAPSGSVGCQTQKLRVDRRRNAEKAVELHDGWEGAATAESTTANVPNIKHKRAPRAPAQRPLFESGD